MKICIYIIFFNYFLIISLIEENNEITMYFFLNVFIILLHIFFKVSVSCLKYCFTRLLALEAALC